MIAHAASSSSAVAAALLALALSGARADNLHECTAPGVQATLVESIGPLGPERRLSLAYPSGNEVTYPDEQITETRTPMGRLQTVTEFRLERTTSLLVPDVVLFDSTPVPYTSWLYQTVTPPPGDAVRQRNRGVRVACTVRFVLPEGEAR